MGMQLNRTASRSGENKRTKKLVHPVIAYSEVQELIVLVLQKISHFWFGNPLGPEFNSWMGTNWMRDRAYAASLYLVPACRYPKIG